MVDIGPEIPSKLIMGVANFYLAFSDFRPITSLLFIDFLSRSSSQGDVMCFGDIYSTFTIFTVASIL